jgi:threonine dehydratase
MNQELSFNDIVSAANRIKPYIKETPLVSNKELNEELGCQLFLKMENQQIINAFKARGVANFLLAYREKHGKFPEKIVAQSSGNHAQAVAYFARKFQIPAVIFMSSQASQFKINAVKALGSELILKEKRSEVNFLAAQKQQEGYVLLHPSADDFIIAGQGTSAFEALNKIGEVTAIFSPCGGGGLIAGTYLASQGLSKSAQVFACEPLNANDTARSLREGKILSYEEMPSTVADGARTLSTSELCFHYIKKMAGVLEIPEEEIIFWQKKLSTILQERIEPTSALSVAGCKQFLDKNPNQKGRKMLAIISGGNVAN